MIFFYLGPDFVHDMRINSVSDFLWILDGHFKIRARSALWYLKAF